MLKSSVDFITFDMKDGIYSFVFFLSFEKPLGARKKFLSDACIQALSSHGIAVTSPNLFVLLDKSGAVTDVNTDDFGFVDEGVAE